MSTLVTVLVLKILSKKYSWNQRFPTEGVRNGENLALFVMGNIVSQGIFFCAIALDNLNEMLHRQIAVP